MPGAALLVPFCLLLQALSAGALGSQHLRTSPAKAKGKGAEVPADEEYEEFDFGEVLGPNGGASAEEDISEDGSAASKADMMAEAQGLQAPSQDVLDELDLGGLSASSEGEVAESVVPDDAPQPDAQVQLSPPSRPAFVHFMFELMDRFNHGEIWDKYFEGGNSSTFMIWAHCVEYKACEGDYFIEKLGIKLVNTVYSKRGTDLVTPMVHMIRHALPVTKHLAGKAVEKFIVLSDSTLPIKPFAFAHQKFGESDESNFCISTPIQWATADVGGRHLVLPKHHQWVTLNRTVAQKLSAAWTPVTVLKHWKVALNEDKWAHNKTTVGRSYFKGGSWYSATDEEAVWGTVFGAMVVPAGQTKRQWATFLNRRCDTYVSFPGDITHPTTVEATKGASLLQVDPARLLKYNPMPLTLALLDDPQSKITTAKGTWHPFVMQHLSDGSLQKLRDSNFLFARKFDECAHMPHASKILLG